MIKLFKKAVLVLEKLEQQGSTHSQIEELCSQMVKSVNGNNKDIALAIRLENLKDRMNFLQMKLKLKGVLTDDEIIELEMFKTKFDNQ